MVPLLSFLIYLQSKELKSDYLEKGSFSDTTRKIVSDSIMNHSTISSLANEDVLIERYFNLEEKFLPLLLIAFRQ